MGNSDMFALYINHGGVIMSLDGHIGYFGGNHVGKFGFDEDRFGFFDLNDEVEKLGYVSWDGLFFKIPYTDVYKTLNDDKDIMDMLKHLSARCRVLSIFMDNGKKIDCISSEQACDGDLTQLSLDKAENESGSEVDEGQENATKQQDKESDMGVELSSEDDLNYTPLDEESTDDNLSDNELAEEDDEYLTSRRSIKSIKTHVEVFNKYVGVSMGSEDIEDEKIEVGEAVSEYDESDGDLNSSSTEDEYDHIKKRRIRITYDPKCDHKQLKVVLGMRFESGYQAREALTTCAIENGWHLRFKRVNKTQMEAKCTPPCNWRCYGSVLKGSDVFKIKTIRGTHDCPRSMNNKLVTSQWIAKQYLNVFRVKPSMSIIDLKEDLLHRYAVYVSKWRLYSARSQAIQNLRGSVEEHYSFMRRYIAELQMKDKDGRFELLLGDGAIFRGLYIGFSALRNGFIKGCRPVIGLDGAFLKTYLGGVLLSAIAKDGNNQMFPIAWAVVEVENQECWSWFLQILLEELGINDGGGFTFISDQQKGLINAVGSLAPFAEHRNCARHVYCNWKKQHKGSTLKNMFWKVCRSTYIEEYKMALEEMKRENEAAYEDFLERGPEKFCKTFISLSPVSDMIDNNMAETFNGYIVNARGKHVIDMLEEIRCSLMERQVRKLNAIHNVSDDVCPVVKKKLEKLKIESRHCIAHPALAGKFEVHLFEESFVVILESKTCTCRVWDLTGIPCVHAISAINFLNLNPMSFVHEYYSINKYFEAYKYGLEPINGKKMWPVVEGYPVRPPLIKKMPGRPKKKRRRDPDERNPKDPNKIRNVGVTMTCKRCMQQGHNRRTCKNDPVVAPPKEQKKRGRPAKETVQGSVEREGVVAKAKNKATVAKAKEKSVVAKERATARKGYGVIAFPETGNIYMPSQRGVHLVNLGAEKDNDPLPRTTTSKATSSSGR